MQTLKGVIAVSFRKIGSVVFVNPFLNPSPSADLFYQKVRLNKSDFCFEKQRHRD